MWSNCNQVGIPSDREQYIHRLGRAGREGKEGRGILLLAPWEEYFLDELKDLPVEKFPSLQLDRDTKLKVLASPPSIVFFALCVHAAPESHYLVQRSSRF